MAFRALPRWILPAALMTVLLAPASPALAETTTAAMTAFGMTGTWSEDCTKDPAKEGARLTYNLPTAGAPGYRFVLFDRNGNQITSSFDILTATTLPEGKIRTVSGKRGANANGGAGLEPW